MVFIRQHLVSAACLVFLSFWAATSWADEPQSETVPLADSAEEGADMDLRVESGCDHCDCEDCDDDECECECDEDGDCDCDCDDFDWGAYANGFALGTRIDGQAAFLSGFEVGPIFNHKFSIGFGAYGLFSQVDGPTYPTGAESIYGFGYAGFVARYYFRDDGPFYGSIGALAGPGGVTILERVSKNEFNWIESQSGGQEIFVVEPSFRFHFEPVRFFRVSAQGSYRFVEGVSDYDLRDKDLSGFAFGIGLELGWF